MTVSHSCEDVTIVTGRSLMFLVPVDAAVAATVAVRDMVSAEVRRTRAERMPILSYEILVHGMPTLF